MAETEAHIDIAAKVAAVRERIARAAERSGRAPSAVTLVAVSKIVEAARVREALAAGVTDLGENYVQEAAQKRPVVEAGETPALPGAEASLRTEKLPAVRWHLIGHLQRNKVKQAVAIFDSIQTVDSQRLAEEIGGRAQEAGKVMPILLQVKTSGEESKSGVAPEQAGELLQSVKELPGIAVQGLMTIGRWDPDPERARPEFRLLAALARKLEDQAGFGLQWLSMGMSHDFEVAIEEGANLVRVGTGIFGARPG